MYGTHTHICIHIYRYIDIYHIRPCTAIRYFLSTYTLRAHFACQLVRKSVYRPYSPSTAQPDAYPPLLNCNIQKQLKQEEFKIKSTETRLCPPQQIYDYHTHHYYTAFIICTFLVYMILNRIAESYWRWSTWVQSGFHRTGQSNIVVNKHARYQA